MVRGVLVAALLFPEALTGLDPSAASRMPTSRPVRKANQRFVPLLQCQPPPRNPHGSAKNCRSVNGETLLSCSWARVPALSRVEAQETDVRISPPDGNTWIQSARSQFDALPVLKISPSPFAYERHGFSGTGLKKPASTDRGERTRLLATDGNAFCVPR